MMPASPIRKLVPFAVAAKKKGIKVYHLNICQPDIHTPKEGLDALKNIDRQVLEYSPTPGIQSYRDKLVGYYNALTSTSRPTTSLSPVAAARL